MENGYNGTIISITEMRRKVKDQMEYLDEIIATETDEKLTMKAVEVKIKCQENIDKIDDLLKNVDKIKYGQ